jgi:hypothetical protein
VQVSSSKFILCLPKSTIANIIDRLASDNGGTRKAWAVAQRINCMISIFQGRVDTRSDKIWEAYSTLYDLMMGGVQLFQNEHFLDGLIGTGVSEARGFFHY